MRGKDKYITFSNLSIYYTWKYLKKSYKRNKFKISAPTWNEEFELPGGSYSESDIQDYISLKKHETVTDNPSIRTENRITFKIRTGYISNFQCLKQ